MNKNEGYEMYRKGYLQGYEMCKKDVQHLLSLFNRDIVDLEIFVATHPNDMKGGAE